MLTGKRYRHHRRGSLIVETLLAMALLMMVIALAAQTSQALMNQRRRILREKIALDGKTELMTFAMALPYDSVTEDALVEFAESRLTDLPASSWNFQVASISAQETAGKKISIQVNHEAGDQSNDRPIVAWRYPTATQETEKTP